MKHPILLIGLNSSTIYHPVSGQGSKTLCYKRFTIISSAGGFTKNDYISDYSLNFPHVHWSNKDGSAIPILYENKQSDFSKTIQVTNKKTVIH